MQKKVTVALFILIIFALGVVLTSLLNKESDEVLIDAQYLSPSQKRSGKDVLEAKTWAQSLAGSDKTRFTFPVNELFMKIDLRTYVPPKIKSYRLVVDRADRYSLFCIVQTLSGMNMPYVIEKQNNIPIIHVSSKTEDNLKEIVNKLRHYDIESKIKEVWL